MSNSEHQGIFHSGPNPLEVLPQTWKYSIVENIMVHRSIKTTQHIDFDFSLGRDMDNADKKAESWFMLLFVLWLPAFIKIWHVMTVWNTIFRHEAAGRNLSWKKKQWTVTALILSYSLRWLRRFFYCAICLVTQLYSNKSRS